MNRMLGSQRFLRLALCAALAALVLGAFPAMALAEGGDYYRFSDFDSSALGGSGTYGPDGWVGPDGISRVVFYKNGVFNPETNSWDNTGFIYKVETDGDPSMHPDNPLATGPVANRTFTLEKTFKIPYNYGHEAECWVDDGTGDIYIGASYSGISKFSAPNYDSSEIVAPASPIDSGYGTQSLARDPETGTWYAGAISWNNEPGTTQRKVWKYTPGDAGWSLAFLYTTADLSTWGTHHDGMEFIDGSLYLADYTGDYINRYTTDGTLLDTFYHTALGHELEGAGYGALGHFWVGSHGSVLSEFGGGRLAEVIDSEGPVTSNVNPAPSVVAAGAPLSLDALVDDTSTGGSAIASAEYSVNGGGWLPLAATDGAYDSPCEGAGGALAGFPAAGVYWVEVRGTDAKGNVGAPSVAMFVVYDPAGGFVTGGGRIMSPEGALSADPTLSGPATFGFVSKYLKGASVPTGNTQFIFHAAGFEFKSTSYEWLVISGARAQYKGQGSVNGTDGFKFMLTAVDGAVTGGGGTDRMRLKVTDSADVVVYDTGLGADDGGDPAIILDGGSIIVHKK